MTNLLSFVHRTANAVDRGWTACKDFHANTEAVLEASEAAMAVRNAPPSCLTPWWL